MTLRNHPSGSVTSITRSNILIRSAFHWATFTTRTPFALELKRLCAPMHNICFSNQGEDPVNVFFSFSFLVFSAYKSRESFKISLSVGLMRPLQTDPSINCAFQSVLSHCNQQYLLKYSKCAFHHNYLDLNLLKMAFKLNS